MHRLAPFVALLSMLVAVLPARAQTPVETIYADLAKLPPAERQAKIEDGARKEGKLVIINTLRGQNVGQAELFRRRYPFVELDATNDIGSQDAAERLYAEETAGRHLTDVVTGALADFQVLLGRNMLARYPTPAAAAILPRFDAMRDEENRWLPWYWSEHGISYNSNMVPPDKAPKDWFDLCNPFFKGNVSFDPAETRFIAGLNALMGETKLQEFFKCMGANEPIIQRGHDQRIALMLAGDHMAQGDNYFFTGVATQRKNPSAPFAMVMTAPILVLSGIAVINQNAQHPYAAALFVDWLLSPENQQYYAAQLRGPVTMPHPFIPDDAPLVAFKDPPPDVTARLVGYWKQYMEKPK